MENLYHKACQVIPGGVNSPVRAFKAVGNTPLFISKAQGAYVYDSDGTAYIDYIGSWGPMILGHAHPHVVKAVQSQATLGLSYGAPTELETELATSICQLVPSCEKVRLVNSGTEATLTAIRLARGYTHRDKIIKFEGGYHGHHDALLVEAGSGAATLGTPSSPGIPKAITDQTLCLPYNNKEALAEAFKQHGPELAALIIEPIAGNMNMVPADPDFLQLARDLCNQHHTLLIFDEVMTGFRVALGGAQELYQIKPDITTLGKVIGGGMPLAAIGGHSDIMDTLAPVGPVYQAGTLSGNPMAVTAGLTTLNTITETPNFYNTLEQRTKALCQGLEALAHEQGIPLTTQSAGGMFGFLFTDSQSIVDYKAVANTQGPYFIPFFQLMLKQNIMLAPSMFEAGFMSICHDKPLIEKTLQAAQHAFVTISSMSLQERD